MQISEALAAQNEAQFAELAALLNTEKPQLLLAVFDHRDLRDEIIEAAISANPALQPVLLDLGKTQVHSLVQAVEEKLPLAILEAEDLIAAIHTVNLEGSLLSEILAGEPKLLTALAEESQGLAGKYTFHWVLWIDTYLYEELQKQQHPLLAQVATTLSFQSGREASANVYHQLTQYQQEIEAAEDPGQLSATFASIGLIMQEAARPQEAMIHFEKALEAGQVSADEKALADAYLGIGHLLVADSDPIQAMENYEISLEKYEALEDRAGETEARIRLARLISQGGSYTDALPHQVRALALLQQTDNLIEIGLNARRLAYFYERKGDLEAAIATYEQAAETYAQLDNPAEVARTWQQIGAICQNQFQWAEALQAFQQALDPARQSGDEYLLHAVEDSIEDMEAKAGKAKASPTKQSEKKKGFFGKLFG